MSVDRFQRMRGFAAPREENATATPFLWPQDPDDWSAPERNRRRCDLWALAIFIAVILIAAVLGFAFSASAAPPPGTNLSGPEHLWWECQHNNGESCCSLSDGHVIKDEDWRQDPVHQESYQVRIDGTWFDVPVSAVIQPAHQCGPEPDATKRSMSKAWYYIVRDDNNKIVDVHFYCFMTGTMY